MANCFLQATAQVIQVPLAQLIEVIGFTGEEIIWEGLQKPSCYRGIHSQQIIDALYQLGYYGILIEKYPRMAPNYDTIPIDGVIEPIKRFKGYLEKHTGVLISHEQAHGWAWRQNDVYKKNFELLCKTDDVISIVDEALLIIKS